MWLCTESNLCTSDAGGPGRGEVGCIDRPACRQRKPSSRGVKVFMRSRREAPTPMKTWASSRTLSKFMRGKNSDKPKGLPDPTENTQPDGDGIRPNNSDKTNDGGDIFYWSFICIWATCSPEVMYLQSIQEHQGTERSSALNGTRSSPMLTPDML